MRTIYSIIVVGRNLERMNLALDLLRDSGFSAAGVLDNAGAVQLFKSQPFDLLVIGGGVDADSRLMLENTFRVSQPQSLVLHHSGPLFSLPGTIAAEIAAHNPVHS